MSDTQAASGDDRLRDLVDELADTVAGDDAAVYAETVVALLNVTAPVVDAPRERRAQLAAAHLQGQRPTARRRAAMPPPPADISIWSDETFLANMRGMVRDRRRIVGGTPTSDFPDCVAIGTENQWCCSGTLVASNLVVTAAHCHDVRCTQRVMFGDDTSPTGGGRIVEVAQVHVHPDYIDGGTNDLAVLVLTEEADGVAPRAVAPRSEVDQARVVRLAGFGNVDVFASHGYGLKRMVDVPVASSNPAFGADPQLEFVAGQPFLDRDSCTGDSGGPAYVASNGEWLLAGATSRATSSSIRPCGDGGIYERIHAFEDWLRSIPDARFDQ
jgi:secreted trypsin-like serine protease